MSKKIYFIISFVLAGCFTSCDTNDNTFYNDVFLNSPNLVYIEASLAGYHVGDRIYVSTSIDRLLNVPGNANLVDIRKSSGNANSYNFSYVLERDAGGGNWEVVDANPSAIDRTAGTITGGSFYYAGAVYSAATDSYDFRAGIPLMATGNYRLSFGYNSSSPTTIELRSESIDNNIFVNIYSNETNNLLNGEGFYTFTVL